MNLSNFSSKRLKEEDVLLEHHLRFHQIDLLEKLELVYLGEEYLVLVLALSPPFVEADGIVLIRYLGDDVRGETREINRHVQTHILLEILGISPAELADQGVENFYLVDVESLLADYHLVDPDGIVIEPGTEFESFPALFSVEGQFIHRIVNFLRIKWKKLFRFRHGIDAYIRQK